MKLVEIFSEFRRATGIVTNLITYPGQVIYQQASLIFQRKLNEVELPIGQDRPSDKNSNNSQNTDQKTKERSKKFNNLTSRNLKNREENIDRNSNNGRYSKVARRNLTLINETNTDNINELSLQEIPTLTEGQEIRGRKGKYKCLGRIIRDEERFRVYEGFHVQTNSPVLIKEYLLIEGEYNQKERRACKEKFAEINKINFRKGNSQDFRIVSPFEAIAPPRENRCYLITEPINNSITLKEYLEKHGVLSPKQIVDLLDQVLQTLWFLNTNRVRLPSGEMQNGMAHGNLNLNTIFLVESQQYSAKEEPQLFVYVSDLAVWEHIFLPPNSSAIKTSFAKDSIALGTVCFYLLSGQTIEPKNDRFLNFRDEEQWPFIDSTLEDFIRRLLGINGQFESALSARQVLLKLRQNQEFEYQNPILRDEAEEEKENNKITKLTLFIAGILLLGIVGLIGTGSFLIVSRILNKQPSANDDRPQNNATLCCLNKVEIPSGEFIYAIDLAMWGNIFERPGLVSERNTLKQELEAKKPLLKNYTVNNSTQDPIEAVRNGEVDFALTGWNDELPEELEQKVVAYNGLVVFVAYSDWQRPNNIPRALKGKISLEQLRKLYTEGERSWILPKELKGWDIKLYLPFAPAEIDLFEEFLFNDKRQIEDYRRLVKKILARQIRQLEEKNLDNPSTTDLLGEISENFEKEQTIGIGFSLLTTEFGQCNIYPLAIQIGHQTIQPLVTTDGKPISPRTDLCNDKGGYWQNVEAFKTGQYPLGYSLVAVYPKNKERSKVGKKFAEMLSTDEGQYLLREAGLVPLRKLR